MKKKSEKKKAQNINANTEDSSKTEAYKDLHLRIIGFALCVMGVILRLISYTYPEHISASSDYLLMHSLLLLQGLLVSVGVIVTYIGDILDYKFNNPKSFQFFTEGVIVIYLVLYVLFPLSFR